MEMALGDRQQQQLVALLVHCHTRVANQCHRLQRTASAICNDNIGGQQWRRSFRFIANKMEAIPHTIECQQFNA